MTSTHAIEVQQLSYHYGNRQVLNDVSLDILSGEIFALLGPNGGGKTTLFRVLSTLIPPQQGDVRILGLDVRRQIGNVRSAIGVVFQAPSLDRKLTVLENLWHQAALYGLSRRTARERGQELLTELGLIDRQHELTETLSGGLRRRVELAKGMIHRPRVLLMDEPSTGLDPGARSDLWKYLQMLRDQFGVTVLLTTHLLEEADKADRIGILHHGTLVALDRPATLRASLGGDAVTIATDEPARLAASISQRFGCDAQVVDGSVRFEQVNGGRWISELMESFPDLVHSITVGKPTLEDVFVQKTGHRFWHEDTADNG